MYFEMFYLRIVMLEMCYLKIVVLEMLYFFDYQIVYANVEYCNAKPFIIVIDKCLCLFKQPV